MERIKFSIVRAQEKDFSVEISAHNGRGLDSDKEVWHWNVYAYIRENHPFFSLSESWLAKELHFHGGITLAEYSVVEPLGGVKYDFQKVNKSIKVGSDYSHYGDDYDNHISPYDGIPIYVKYDADILVGQLHSAIRRLTSGV